MKPYYFIFVFFVLAAKLPVFAQIDINIVQQATIGGSGDDYRGKGVKLKNSDHYMMCSYSNSNKSFDKSDDAIGTRDIWVLKLNMDLTIVWDTTFGGNDTNDAFDIIETKDGNFLIAGRSSSPPSGTKTAENFGLRDYWLIKMDDDGNILWDKTYGGSSTDVCQNVIEMENGDLILTGWSNSPISGNKTSDTNGSTDYWIVKTDADGNILWDRSFGGNGIEDNCYSALNDNNELVVAGFSYYKFETTGDKSFDGYGAYDIWVIKINTETGALIWEKTIGGSELEYSLLKKCVEVIGTDIYTICYSNSLKTGTKSENKKGIEDIWITKLDNDGNIIWDKTIGGAYTDRPTYIKKTASNQLLITASSNSEASFDKSEDRWGASYDIWFFALNTDSAHIIYDKTIGGTDHEGSNDVILLDNNHYIIVGNSYSDISGDKSQNSKGGSDIWLVEIFVDIETAVSENSMPIQQLTLFPNPTYNKVTLEVETNKQELLQLNVYDLNGKIVHQSPPVYTHSGKNSVSVNLEHLVQGMYILEIELDNNVYHKKINVLNN
jgi:hypothetical protein